MFRTLPYAAAVITAAFALGVAPINLATASTRIVGSSTVHPFAELARQQLGDVASSIQIESTGTSGGLLLFCKSTDPEFAPISLASRRIKSAEKGLCAQTGINNIEEVTIGRSGVVLVNKSRRQPAADFTPREIFMALAANLPSTDTDCRPTHNSHSQWRDIAPHLPKEEILVFGPPITSGTRQSFIQLAMEEGALTFTCLRQLKKEQPRRFLAMIQNLRTDGRWVDAGENESALLAAIQAIPHAYGVSGYPLYLSNKNRLGAAKINGVAPNSKSIASGKYALTRSLFFYVNRDAVAKNSVAQALLNELISENAIGPDGYLADHGLTPVGFISDHN